MTQPISLVIGKSGRLGRVVATRFNQMGYAPDNGMHQVNYLVFAHRYRGAPSYRDEMDAHIRYVADIIDGIRWRDGDRAIVIVSSVCATDPVADQPLSYNVSKAAQLQLARYYAKTLRGVRCNTVSPAAFTGANPVVSIEQVADVIAFLCSPASSGINGQDIRVTGGYCDK